MGAGQKRGKPRLPTGIPGLDRILHGGLLAGHAYMVMGRPGAGKTVLGSQICFNHIAAGGRALYVTLLSESHASLVSNLEGFDFFRPDALADTLKFLSGYRPYSSREGLGAVRELLAKAMRDQRATLLVIDGFVTAGALAGSDVALKEFVHELQTLLALHECTALLLTGSLGPDATYAERTMVDGLLHLTAEPLGAECVRQIEVSKLRGSGHLTGRHVFEITSAGIRVFPRLEAVYGRRPAGATGAVRCSLGGASFDAITGGGLPCGSSTLLLGSPGSGKTLLGLQFAATGTRAGEKALHVSFFEPPARSIENARLIGLDLRPEIEQGRLDLMWHPPIQLHADDLGQVILDKVARSDIKRVIIDDLSGLRQSTARPERFTPLLTALCNELRAQGTSVLAIDETSTFFGPELPVPASGISVIADNVLLLRCAEVEGALRRIFSLFKIRGRQLDTSVRELVLSPSGLDVGAPLNGSDEILTGTAKSPFRSPGESHGHRARR